MKKLNCFFNIQLKTTFVLFRISLLLLNCSHHFGHDLLNLLLDNISNFFLHYIQVVVILCRLRLLQNHIAVIIKSVEMGGITAVAYHVEILLFTCLNLHCCSTITVRNIIKRKFRKN